MKQIKKTITKAEIAAMPKVLFPGRIFVIYTESEAEKAVAYLKDQRIVGWIRKHVRLSSEVLPIKWLCCKYLRKIPVSCFA